MNNKEDISQALIFENTILDILKQICVKSNKGFITFGEEIVMLQYI